MTPTNIPSTDIKNSIVQPGVSVYHLPDLLPGQLLYELTDRIGGGSYSHVFRGTWLHNDKIEVVSIKQILEDRIKFDDPVPGLTPEEQFERVGI